MLSAIAMNWRGRPLQTHEVAVQTIAATTNKSGLTIRAHHPGTAGHQPYQRGARISDCDMKTFEATRPSRHANYCASPKTALAGRGTLDCRSIVPRMIRCRPSRPR